ncbi:MAG: aspartate--tRNA ligase [bacterium]|nr:aspartate--tRNA ligase [bacterium]
MDIYRNCNCEDLRITNVGREVILSGWVQRRRDHGGLVFVDLRDNSGIVQIVFSSEVDIHAHLLAHKIRTEFVIKIKGMVSARPEGTKNLNLSTGDIEVYAEELVLLNESKVLPFLIEEEVDVSEDIRLKYRYLDIRRPNMKKNLFIRHKTTQITRNFLDKLNFMEIETPMLIKSTPEGARDFLVPSRLNPGKFYALPQSPQLFKQILMASGIERYFQIAKCFRDEDLRADRQPEFTQVDIEMSFINMDDILTIIENLLKEVFKITLERTIKTPFLRMSYQEAVDNYGTDKPDIRFDLKLYEITEIVKDSEFQVFKRVIKDNGIIKGIKVPQKADYSRKEIEDLTSFVSIYGAKGLSFFKVVGNELESPITKFFDKELLQNIYRITKANDGDILFFVADQPKVVNLSLSNLRLHIAKELNLIDNSLYKFLWVVDFPFLEYNEDEKRWECMHHPFTSPTEESMHLLEANPQKVKAKAYDLVLNGVEIGGGSIRIHKRELQERVFNILNISSVEAKKKFGFLLEAFDYGTPPHGGIALGLDRLLATMLNAISIRDFIAFPKTQSGTCLLTNAPFDVNKNQLKELYIKTDVITPLNKEKLIVKS